MPTDTVISALTSMSLALAAGDLIPMVDVSATGTTAVAGRGAGGTTKKLTLAALQAAMGAFPIAIAVNAGTVGISGTGTAADPFTSADGTAGIQDAVTTLGTTGGTILLGPYVYQVDDTKYITCRTNNITFQGASTGFPTGSLGQTGMVGGTVIRHLASTAQNLFKIGGGSIDQNGIRFIGIGFDGSSNKSTPFIVDGTYAINGLVIDHCAFFQTDCILKLSASAINCGWLTNNIAQSCNAILNSSEDGSYFGKMLIAFNEFRDCQLGTAAYFNTAVIAGYYQSTENIICFNVFEDSTGVASASIPICIDLLGDRNQIYGNWFRGYQQYIRVCYGVDNIIKANQFMTGSTVVRGVQVLGAAATGTQIVDNYFQSGIPVWISLWDGAGQQALNTIVNQPGIPAAGLVGADSSTVLILPVIERIVTGDFSNATTTLAAITGLTATLLAGATYEFEATLYTTSAIADGIKFALSGTATVTSLIAEAVVVQSGALVAPGTTRISALDTAFGNVTAVTVARVDINGTVVINAAGTLLIQFAENAHVTGTSKVLLGSKFLIRRIA